MTATIFGKSASVASQLPGNLSWARSPSWRALPVVLATDEKIVGLVAISPTGLGNVLSLTCAGNYTVDWGDGTTENFNSGVQANHEYDFSDADLANTDAPVTITASGGLFTRVAHGLSNGDLVFLYRIQTTTGITEGTPYWVISATQNTFQVAASKGGAAVSLTNDGSASLSQYKQAIVVVTAQGGSQLTSVNLNVRHPSLGTFGTHTSWLDLIVSMPNCASSGMTLTGSTAKLTMCQQVVIKNSGSLTSMASLFSGATGLQNAVVSGCAAVTSMASMFSGCHGLITASLSNTSQVTNISSMFALCASLQSAPLFDTSGATNASRMFEYSGVMSVPQYNLSSLTDGSFMFNTCVSLQSIFLTTTFGASCSLSYMFTSCANLSSVNLPNTGNVTNMGNMFNACRSLSSVTIPNTGAATSMTGMFQGCYGLQNVSLPTTGSVTDMSYMFSTCYALQNVFMPNTGAATNMSYMFQSCYSLSAAPVLNTVSVTNARNMFQNCYALKSVPAYNFAACTNGSYMFSTCYNLRSSPAMTFGGATCDLSYMFENCTALSSVGTLGTSTATNMASMFSGCSALQTISLFDTSKATDTNTMFSGCSSLQTVPLFDLSLSTGIYSMFSNCRWLVSVPAFNTASATSASSMFLNCYNLAYAPALNTASVNNFGSMFNGCYALQVAPNYSTAAVTSMSSMLSGAARVRTAPAYNLATISSGSDGASIGNTSTQAGNLTQYLAYNMTKTFNVGQNRLSLAALGVIFDNLGAGAGQTMTITGNPGVPAAVSKSSLATTAKSLTINVSDTSNLTTGMFCTNSTIWASVNMTADVTADTLTLVGHNISNGTRVSFSSLGTVTGVSTYTPYYVVNAAADTFQISLTAGGAPIDLTGSNGTMSVRWYSKIASINANVSVTLDAPTPTTQTNQTISFRALDATRALLRGWLISY